MVQTVEGRKALLRQLANKFSRHLETVPGSALKPEHRLFVVSQARTALSCTACSDQLGEHFIEKKVFDALAKSHDDEKEDTQLLCLTRIVHGIINYQASLNIHWYQDAIKDLESSGVTSRIAACNESTMALAPCYVAFAEIVTLSSISHGIHVAFLTLDMEVPPLPVNAAPGPSNINYVSLLKRPFRLGSDTPAPYFLWSDINRSSPELKKLRETSFARPPECLDPTSPAVGIIIALEDLFMFQHFMDATYLSSTLNVLRAWKPLDPDNHCPSVTRYDVELVAKTIALGHQCGY